MTAAVESNGQALGHGFVLFRSMSTAAWQIVHVALQCWIYSPPIGRPSCSPIHATAPPVWHPSTAVFHSFFMA